jgi:hypothetical protein
MRVLYNLGWVFFALAVVERILLLSPNIASMAMQHNVLPRNFFELSLLFFVISIATERCCGTKTP